MNKTVLIIGSAHLCSKCVTDTLSGKPYVLAADGGLDRCIRLGILPDLLVGDMDSAKTGWDKFVREHNIPVIRHPVRKDKSDLELAIEEALKITPGEIVLSGVIGGRTDHTLFNLQLLHTILDEGVPCRIVTCREEITPARSPHTINAPPETVVSLVPCSKVTGVTLAGFSYPLDNRDLKPGTSLGLSNTITSPPARITFREGRLLVIVNRHAVDKEIIKA